LGLKNILLIVVDTLRPDHLGCYGYRRPTSPNLDALAARSHILRSLWSASNFTAPAFTSLFTGRYPHQHGIFEFTAQAKHSALYDFLKANKVDCGGVVAFRFFRNLLQNIWGDIEAVTDTRSFNFSKNLPMDVTDASLAWLDARAGQDHPFCLFVHYDGPHMPFRLPDDRVSPFDNGDTGQVDPFFRELLLPGAEVLDDSRNKSAMYNLVNAVNWKRRKVTPATLDWIVDKYDASVKYNDEAIGQLLDGLADRGLSDDTVIAVLSDHGEEFLEHGGFAHGGAHLYEEIVNTVGIIHDPANPGKGQPVAGPASQVDILPTLIQLAGAETVPPGLQERAIPLIQEKTGRPPVFCHGKFKMAVRYGAHKLIVPRPHPTLGTMARFKLWIKMALQGKLGVEVFDLEQDPQEKRNLTQNKSLRSALRKILQDHLASGQPGPQEIGIADKAEQERIEKEMKDLGYM